MTVEVRMSTIHQFLTEDGMYVHTHYDEEIEETGDAESGPRLYYSPEYDEYAGESHYIFIERGVVLEIIPRDIYYEERFENFFNT